jgi:hypothetical protein
MAEAAHAVLGARYSVESVRQVLDCSAVLGVTCRLSDRVQV